MRYLSLLLLCVCCRIAALAQFQYYFEDIPETDSTRFRVEALTQFQGNSNKISNAMQRKLLWGGFMDRNLLSRERDHLNQNGNRFGYDFRNRVTFQWKTSKGWWSAGVKFRELLGLKFTKDFYGILFLGNTGYERQWANLSNVKLDYGQYTGLSFGKHVKLNNGLAGTLYVGVSALYGLGYQSMQTKRGSLYTATDAEYMELDADIRLQDKNPGYSLGAGLDLGYRVQRGKNTFTISIEDLGWMRWKSVAISEGDVHSRFSGIRLNSFTSFNGDSLFSDFSGDGLASQFGIREKTDGLTTLLPFSVSAKFLRQLSSQWSASAEVNYLYMAGYLPRGSLKIYKELQHGWRVNGGVGYGGFGKKNTLLGLSKQFGNNWLLQVDAYFLGMLLHPASSHGLGINAGLQKTF